jgi:hypothetical protein
MTSRVLRALAYAVLSAAIIPAAAFAAASKPPAAPVFAPGTVQSVAPVIQKTYGPPCPLKPTILHAVASVSLGRWWIHKQDPQCIHIQRGQRVTVELDSGRTVILDQLALQKLHPGDRIWLDESLWQATPAKP